MSTVVNKNKRKSIKIRKGKGKKMNHPPLLVKTPGSAVFTGTKAPKAPTFWETDIEVVKSCGVISKPIDVFISAKARSKMNFLMGKFKSIEWLAYLIGNKENNLIEDIIIPKQRVTSVRVVVDGTVDVPVIGVIHSHHDMGNGFSHTDDEYINQNHDISLCITHNRITGHVRVKTECNRYSLVPANVMDQVVGFVPADFEKEISDNISEIIIPPFFPGNGVKINTTNSVYDDLESMGAYDNIENYYDPNFYKKLLVKRGDDDLMDELNYYNESIDGVTIDECYVAEFTNLVRYIESIGTQYYDACEAAAFEEIDNVFTEPYYRLIDEISVRFDNLTERESVALNKLAKKLYDILNEYNAS